MRDLARGHAAAARRPYICCVAQHAPRAPSPTSLRAGGQKRKFDLFLAQHRNRTAEAATTTVYSRGGGIKGRIAWSHREGDLAFNGLGVGAGWKTSMGSVLEEGLRKIPLLTT